MNCETSAITMATSMLPEARNAETMQSCTPMPPQARHMMRMKRAPSAMTSASPGTKNADQGRRETVSGIVQPA